MSDERQQTVLCVTVDIGTSGAPAEQRSMAGAVGSLLAILNQHGIAACWSLADPSQSPLAQLVLDSAGRHELGLLGEAGWSGGSVPRPRFASQLSRRLLRARSSGISVGTLALAGRGVPRHVDLLVKYGIQVVREHPAADCAAGWFGRTLSTSATRMGKPTPLRWGLWSMRPSLRLPGVGLMSARRGIDRAVAASDFLTLVLDAREIAAAGKPAIRLVDRVLSAAARRCEQGKLTAGLPREVVARLTPTRRGVPMRSILRPAA